MQGYRVTELEGYRVRGLGYRVAELQGYRDREIEGCRENKNYL